MKSKISKNGIISDSILKIMLHQLSHSIAPIQTLYPHIFLSTNNETLMS